MHKGRVPPVPYRKFLKQIAIGQAVFAIGLSPLLPLTAVAQSVAPAPSGSPTGSPGGTSTFTVPSTPSNIILPTDVLPLNAAQDRIPFGENLLLRLNQYLPSRFYFSSSIETSLRFETNPFQFPRKSRLVRQLPQGQAYERLSLNQKYALQKIIQHTDSQDTVFRILPNVSGGWTLTPRTRVFGNYFMIRDQLAKNVQLNTMIHSYAWGFQQDIPLSSRANLQAEMQFRELNQWHQQSVFDFLPGLTLSYIANPRTVLFVNALLQMRGKKYFQAPTKELDPFYTWGLLHTRGGWTFAASSTFVQNFREPFGHNATIPITNYAFISDFEIARRLFRNVPGLQAFVRAEPIFNFHSHEHPGLAGTDFRLFYGLRMAVAKPALTNTINNIMEQLRQQEGDPPSSPNKPSAMMPDNVVAGLQQPIHGLNDGASAPSAVNVPVVSAGTEAAANTIASTEDDGVADGGASNVVATQPVIVDLSKADWGLLVATLPDEADYTLSSIHQSIAEAVAESTSGTGYEATSSRLSLIATKPAEKPHVDLAKLDGWDKLANVVGAGSGPITTLGSAELVERGAAASTGVAYDHTARHTSLIAQRFEAKPVVAQKPASPPTVAPAPKVIIALAHEASDPTLRFPHVEPPKAGIALAHEASDPTLRFPHVEPPKALIALAHEASDPTVRFPHVEPPKAVIALAHEASDPTARFPHVETPKPVIALAHEASDPTARFPHVEPPKAVIALTHEASDPTARFPHVEPPKAIVALTHEASDPTVRFPHVEPPKAVIALTHEASDPTARFAHVEPPKAIICLTHEAHPAEGTSDWHTERQHTAIALSHESEITAQTFAHIERVSLSGIDWSLLANAASLIRFPAPTLDAGTTYDTIASSQSASTSVGVDSNDARLAQLVHVAPRPTPAPRAPMIATARLTPPQPIIAHEPSTPPSDQVALPTPERLTVTTSSAPPKQLSLAAAISPLPMTPTAAVSRSTQKPLSAAVSAPSFLPPSTVASTVIAPQPLTEGLSHRPMPVTPRLTFGRANAAGGPAAPAPTAIAIGAADVSAPELARIASVPAGARLVPAPPTPMKVEAPVSAAADMLASLPAPVSAPAAAKLDSANWEGVIAAAFAPKPMLSMQFLGNLRSSIERAANDSARVLDYTVLHARDHVRIASKPPSGTGQAPQRAVLMVPMQGAAAPRSITSERPGETSTNFVMDEKDDPTRVRGWHTKPSAVSATTMKIVPPLPTVRIREGEKKDPFKEAGLDIKMPVMLSLPR